MKVAVPWLQHSQRFGHCALSQTVCNRKSEISALVEKKTGFDGNRTLIQGGFCVWCRAGSILAQDISKKSYNVKKVTKVKSLRIAFTNADAASSSRTWSSNFVLLAGGILPTISGMIAISAWSLSRIAAMASYLSRALFRARYSIAVLHASKAAPRS
jgi:hypothetical protein